MALPLEVFADLQIAVDGEDVDVQAHGDRIVVDLNSLEAGRRLLSAYPFVDGRRPDPIDRMQEALQIAGLTVEVRLRGDLLARVGEGARPGRLGRLFNLDGVELRPVQTFRAAARERRLATVFVIGALSLLIGGLFVWAWRRNT